MAENLSYLCVNLDEISEKLKLDSEDQRELLLHFLVDQSLVDSFLNFVEENYQKVI